MAQMRTRIVFGLVLSLLAICVPLLAQEPCTVSVRPSESIQAAIDAAPEGAVICLAEGTWTEVLTVTKTLTLRAERASRTIIQPSRTGPVVVIRYEPGETVPHVVIEDLSITGAWGWGAYGVPLVRTARASIVRCVVSVCKGSGIGLWGETYAWTSDCTVYDNHIAGIDTAFGSQATVTSCRVTGNLIGIMVQDTAQITITACTVDENWGDGIVLAGMAVAHIENSVIASNGAQGVTLGEEACAWTSPDFAGRASGWENKIPAPGGALANIGGAVCPEALLFLLTDEGGELDRRD